MGLFSVSTRQLERTWRLSLQLTVEDVDGLGAAHKHHLRRHARVTDDFKRAILDAGARTDLHRALAEGGVEIALAGQGRRAGELAMPRVAVREGRSEAREGEGEKCEREES
jgi:hypothetical protein